MAGVQETESFIQKPSRNGERVSYPLSFYPLRMELPLHMRPEVDDEDKKKAGDETPVFGRWSMAKGVLTASEALVQKDYSDIYRQKKHEVETELRERKEGPKMASIAERIDRGELTAEDAGMKEVIQATFEQVEDVDEALEKNKGVVVRQPATASRDTTRSTSILWTMLTRALTFTTPTGGNTTRANRPPKNVFCVTCCSPQQLGEEMTVVEMKDGPQQQEQEDEGVDEDGFVPVAATGVDQIASA
ncbi:unnamed protein product [Vitrella brassicaformis CCMP3155]|uniref:Uncharacterized protein n=1 Tax=Vitrella brassicaformis (strain CCMP3155) TaxID=1169540 RepID=A0A0G4FF33_VITBC|nr:unnamed protein product [Vitrella brassicaformis CCMP3155]|mmetsp:Transcript_12552/g.29946  ORF Transcript_12552/g.29946 Transcript_12552/m.29946 type:complete len:246 (+) Transcript_12552:52-789(+)|eukprot:CEM11657.1 unnamed protein product [Vitrella brassicaformis CCMP3155]